MEGKMKKELKELEKEEKEIYSQFSPQQLLDLANYKMEKDSRVKRLNEVTKRMNEIESTTVSPPSKWHPKTQLIARSTGETFLFMGGPKDDLIKISPEEQEKTNEKAEPLEKDFYKLLTEFSQDDLTISYYHIALNKTKPDPRILELKKIAEKITELKSYWPTEIIFDNFRNREIRTKIVFLIEIFEVLDSKEYQKLLKHPTFAIPSHPLMFTLLAMFAGKPDKIPRKLLEKPYNERTPEEQKEADEFLNSILDTETRTSYTGEGLEEREDKRIALISDNPKVEAKAKISGTLFSSDLSFREGALAIFIKKAFGAEGLRHLLGLIIGLEENFRQGHFEWTVNEHLIRLGYKQHHKGGFKSNLKKTATEIVKIFTSLFITAHQKDNKGRERIQGERLFSIDGFRIDMFNKEIIDERIKLRATDFWYRNAFEPTDEKAPMYTKLLKKIAKENHRNHPLTVYLAPLFAIFWRMRPEQKLSIKSLMDWCDLDINGHNRIRDLRDLEAELNYMKNNDYLSNWTNNGEQALPSECRDPFKSVLTLAPPNWLREEIKEIGSKKEQFFLYSKQGKTAPLITRDEFLRLLNNSGCTINQFANHLGISRQMVSYIKSGKKNISPQVDNKIREVFGHMLPV